jgi:FkbM family methyltransferase
MNLKSLCRNPLYRAYPEAAARRLLCTLRHPPRKSRFETTLFWGDRFTSIYDDDMGQSQWRYGLYDLPVCEVIARILKPGDRALDIGANVGQMTLLMGRAIRGAGCVESYEPHPAIFRILKDNCDGSSFKSRIKIQQAAISDRDGTARLAVPATFDANIGTSSLEASDRSSGNIVVATYRLDTLYPAVEDIDLVKVDVEGHELAVFRGAHELLSRKAIRAIIFEANTDHNDVFSLLAGYGYHLFAINTLERVVEHPLSELKSNIQTGNYLALRDIEDAKKIRAPSTLVIKTLANNRLQFTFCPGRAKRN